MKEEKYRLFAAYDESMRCIQIVGFQQQTRLSVGNIIYIAADETYLPLGIGSSLLNFVKSEAAQHNIDTIILESGMQRTAAIAMIRDSSKRTIESHLYKIKRTLEEDYEDLLNDLYNIPIKK